MESDFTRFEYQEAHAAMLKMQHKVIPLLLEDVAQQKHLMDRTLASILKSITYIEWPRVGSEEDLDKFWTRLELSLPKKRAGSSSPSSSYPVLSFSESSFDSQLTDIDMISMENGGTETEKVDADIRGRNDIETVIGNAGEKRVLESGTKIDIEQSLNDTNLTKGDLKECVKGTVGEERIQQMRERASGYENCLNTYL